MKLVTDIIRSILNIFDNNNEKELDSILKKNLKKKIVIIDVGAHNGETIFKYLKLLKVKKIYSFEPQKSNFYKLEKIQKNLKERLEVFNLGLGNKNTSMTLNIPTETSSSTLNNLNRNSKYYHRKNLILFGGLKFQKQKVKLIKLDSFINKKKIEKVDLLKIDTEGFEYFVLKGFTKNIRKFICEICKKGFKSESTLKTHVENIHTKDRDYKCNQCEQHFSSLSKDSYHWIQRNCWIPPRMPKL